METAANDVCYSEGKRRLRELVMIGQTEKALQTYGLDFLYSLEGESRMIIEKALGIKHKSAVDIYNSGVLALEKEDLADAENAFKKAIKLDPQYSSPHFNLALIHQFKGQKTKAKKEWQIFIEKEEAYRKDFGIRISCEHDDFDSLVEAKEHLKSIS